MTEQEVWDPTPIHILLETIPLTSSSNYTHQDSIFNAQRIERKVSEIMQGKWKMEETTQRINDNALKEQRTGNAPTMQRIGNALQPIQQSISKLNSKTPSKETVNISTPLKPKQLSTTKRSQQALNTKKTEIQSKQKKEEKIISPKTSSPAIRKKEGKKEIPSPVKKNVPIKPAKKLAQSKTTASQTISPKPAQAKIPTVLRDSRSEVPPKASNIANIPSREEPTKAFTKAIHSEIPREEQRKTFAKANLSEMPREEHKQALEPANRSEIAQQLQSNMHKYSNSVSSADAYPNVQPQVPMMAAPVPQRVDTVSVRSQPAQMIDHTIPSTQEARTSP